MNTQTLVDIGLTPNQATIYLYLIEKGPLTAGILARKCAIKRTLVYLVLSEMTKLNLVVRNDDNKVARFSATSPQNLSTLVQNKEASSVLAKSAYDASLHTLQQAYEIQTGQPGVRFYSGPEGLKEVYMRINRDRPKEILLIRSSEMEADEQMNEIARKQVVEQVRLGIQVRVISPTLDYLDKIIPKDKERNTERRIIAREVFNTKAQIIIWNDSVAITTYLKPIVTTLVEQSDIASTMQVLFGFIWRQSLVDTKENLKRYQNKTQ